MVTSPGTVANLHNKVRTIKRLVVPLLMGVCVIPFLIPHKVHYEKVVIAAPKPQILATSTINVEGLHLPPILKQIAWCESNWRQWNDDGSVLRGRQNNQDVGFFQINEYYHLETAESLGINIYTLEGNVEYALMLYETQGTTPWNWSKHCWS